jgi:hypothetical protein
MSKKAAIAAANKALAAQGKIEVPRDVEVQNKLEVAHSAFLQTQGRAIILKTAEVGKLYLELCLYIRSNKVAPKLISFELARQGFKRSRISEIVRVSQASDRVFSDWQAKRIGFGSALHMSRIEKPGQKPTLTQAAALLTEGGQATPDEIKEAVASENAPKEAGTRKTTGEKIKSCWLFILKNYKGPDKTWHSKESVYSLTITKLGKTGPAVGDDDAGSDNDGNAN